MMVTREAVAGKLLAYLRHELILPDLVNWAQDVMQEGDFDDADYEILRHIVSRIGVADVHAFGLTWDDCEQFLRQLGYTVRIEVVAQR